MLATCECCKQARAVIKRTAHLDNVIHLPTGIEADLCQDCAYGRPCDCVLPPGRPCTNQTHRPHTLQMCLVGPDGVFTEPVCGKVVWTCAQMTHVRQHHPEALTYREHQPEDTKAKSHLTYIGQIDPTKLLED